MKSILIADDIYQYLLLNSQVIGEDASSILRRLLKIGTETVSLSDRAVKSQLDELLESHQFRYASGVVGKFLLVLSWLHQRHGEDFERITAIRGRRVYFAKDCKTLEESGTNVNPKQIPGSKYWVITTSPTVLKKDMLGQALDLFGYDKNEIERACKAIAP